MKKRPHVLQGHTVFYDVDGTLVFWNVPEGYAGPTVHITAHNAYSKMDIDKAVAVNVPMIENLKGNKQTGCHILVWSQGGHQWAEAVIKALGLEEFVDVIVDKPSVIYDDLEPSAWMPNAKHIVMPGWVKDDNTGYFYYRGDQNG